MSPERPRPTRPDVIIPRHVRERSDAPGRGPTRSTSPTTTRSGGSPPATTATSSRCSILEGAQAGLSWITILRKREGYRKAFAGFDPAKVARFGPEDVERLLGDPGIVRNRLKVESAIGNAKAFLALQAEAGSFSEWLWAHVDGKPVQGTFREMREVPAKTPLAERISKDLLKRGFRFVGPTIVYAYLQAVGVVNDHLVACPRRRQESGEEGRAGRGIASTAPRRFHFPVSSCRRSRGVFTFRRPFGGTSAFSATSCRTVARSSPGAIVETDSPSFRVPWRRVEERENIGGNPSPPPARRPSPRGRDPTRNRPSCGVR